MNLGELNKKSQEIRRNVLELTYNAQSGHTGPSLSWADIATTLFFYEMKLNKNDKRGRIKQTPTTIAGRNERDIFILSKGHSVPTLYAAINLLNPEYLSNDELKTLRTAEGRLEGHPVSGSFPLIDASTGSLGQGLSIAQGYAIANKIKNRDSHVYVVLGDGETEKGQIYEAAVSISKFASRGKISCLTAILDNNEVQGDGTIEDTMPSLNPIKEKWESYGWAVKEVDGHSNGDLINAYEEARCSKRPMLIIAKTKKGKGVSFMEENPLYWHGGTLNQEQYEKALKEIGGKNE